MKKCFTNLSRPPAFYMWNNSGLNVTIPRRRGKGYLKQPYGNHYVPKIECARSRLGNIDFFGLDGYLELDYGMICDRVKQVELAGEALPILAECFGFNEWIEDHKRFWETVNVGS